VKVLKRGIPGKNYSYNRSRVLYSENVPGSSRGNIPGVDANHSECLGSSL
jgi:hypothetical protein